MAVIVLTGMPASGKSTICKHLVKAFGYPVIEKDKLKEHLFDQIGFNSYQEKRRLDYAANAVVIQVVEQLLLADGSVIVDNNFDQPSGKVFSEMIAKYQPKCVTVFLKGDPEEMYRRYALRDSTGSRHVGHAVQDHYPPLPGENPRYTMTREEFEEKFFKRGMDYFTCPGARLEVDTTDLDTVDVPGLIRQIRACLEEAE